MRQSSLTLRLANVSFYCFVVLFRQETRPPDMELPVASTTPEISTQNVSFEQESINMAPIDLGASSKGYDSP